MTSPRATAVATRPAMNTQDGRGVPRTRLSTPLSRCWVRVMDS